MDDLVLAALDRHGHAAGLGLPMVKRLPPPGGVPEASPERGRGDPLLTDRERPDPGRRRPGGGYGDPATSSIRLTLGWISRRGAAFFDRRRRPRVPHSAVYLHPRAGAMAFGRERVTRREPLHVAHGDAKGLRHLAIRELPVAKARHCEGLPCLHFGARRRNSRRLTQPLPCLCDARYTPVTRETGGDERGSGGAHRKGCRCAAGAQFG